MSYEEIKDFKTGVDRTRPIVAGPPGSLFDLTNAHITRGGDVERSKSFVLDAALPASTFGLHTVRGKRIVFGSAAEPAGLPANILYQRLQAPNSAAMSKVLDAENFNGQVYVAAEYADGGIYHFFNGTRVTAWDTISASVSSLSAVAQALAEKIDLEDAYFASANGAVLTITAAVPGTPFTISETATNGAGVDDQSITPATAQANVVGVTEVLSSGTFDIVSGVTGPGNELTSVTVDGFEVLSVAVPYDTTNDNTAQLVADQINAFASTPEYTASATGSTVTISAIAGTGSAPNTFAISTLATGLFSVGTPVNFAGGIDAVTAVAQIVTETLAGTFETDDLWSVTIDGTTFNATGGSPGVGGSLATFDSKIYTVVQSLLYFCKIGDPTDWTGTGAGNINFANQDSGSELLAGLGSYQGQMTVFARSTIQVETVDADPLLNVLAQTIKNQGSFSPKSIVSYGDTDLFYLSDTGIRSVKARDSSNSASVSDVGTRIDPLLEEFLGTISDATISDAVGVIEPRDGRYWLAIGTKIFVFSFFSSTKISAWSAYEPGFAISDFAVLGRRLYARSGDNIYLYGGAAGTTYPAAGETPVTVQLPFMTAKRPGDEKTLNGFDASANNVWGVEVLLDPDDLTKKTGQINISGLTYRKGGIGMNAKGTHFAPKLVCSAAGFASLTGVIVHFTQAEETV